MPPDVCMAGDNAKMSEAARTPRLDWQNELDASMAEIDTRLVHPRRRATDVNPQPQLPGLGDVNITADLLDAIAWRVAEQMRRQAAPSPAPALDVNLAPPLPPPTRTPARAPVVRDEGLRPGKMLMIRYQMPVLPWPFRLLQRRRRRRPHPLTTARASA